MIGKTALFIERLAQKMSERRTPNKQKHYTMFLAFVNDYNLHTHGTLLLFRSVSDIHFPRKLACT